MSKKATATSTKKPARKPMSKAAKAQKVFDKFFGDKTRGEIIEKLQGKSVGLTKAGASTYYTKMAKAAASAPAAE